MTSKTEVHYNESGNGKLYYAEDVEARYDVEKQQAYLEYPDGRRECRIK